MKYCRQCKVNIVDDTKICPLCHSVLERDGEEQTEPMYPSVSIPKRKYHMLMRICTVMAILAMVLLAVINYLTYKKIMWSVISDAGILYLLLTLRYTMFNTHEGHTMKIFVQSIAFMVLVVVIDCIIGYQGWSFDYAIPCTIMLVDGTIVVMMIVNMENWQNYILLQLSMVVMSIVLLVLYLPGFLTHPVLAIVAAGISAAMFLLTVLFGDRRAQDELKRRFHI